MLTFPRDTKAHFFQSYQKYQFLRPEILSGYIWLWYEASTTKKRSFLGKMAGDDGKITFCYIYIYYLKIEIRYALRPSHGAGLIRFYRGNR